MIRPQSLIEFMDKNGLFIPDELVALAEAEKSGKPTPPLPEGVQTVLVVDDDASLRNLFARALSRYRILQAETGYEALHVLTMHDEVELVCLDLNMRGIDGLQTLEEIKASHPDLPVIIISAYTGEIPQRIVEDGMVAKVMDKPVRSEQLAEAVAAVLDTVA